MHSKNWKKVNQILQSVLEIAPDARKEYLDRAGLDRSVRREVEALLAFEEAAADSMHLSAVEFSRDFFDEDDSNLLIGQQIGPYEVVAELGYGGMGAVYLAERADGKFSQRVALKLLKREMNTVELRRRFQQEREILASLEHPNIARLLDAGMTDDRIPYLAMEYVEGVPIDNYCNRHDLDLNRRLDLFRRVCSAVDFAHRNLIVHRDLKPSNILVTEEGIPKLLDFGISKILTGAETGNAVSATITRMGVMTTGYASPEQLQRKSVTTATDIYSLGVILYELLTGRRPFREKEENAEEMRRAILESDPLLPSHAVEKDVHVSANLARPDTNLINLPRQGAQTVPIENSPTGPGRPHVTAPQKVIVRSQDLRGDLDNIVLKALKKEPAERYSSAENLAADIERHQRGLPVRARPDTLSYRTGKFIKRNRLAVGTGLLILLVLIGGVAATLWQASVARAERAKAEKRFNDVRTLANSVLFEITPEIENLSGSTRARELLVSRALQYLDSLAGETSEDDPALQRELAAAYEKVGDVQGNPFQANIGNMQGALDSYRKARTIRSRLLAGNPGNIDLEAELAKNSQLLGDVLFYTGEIKKAEEIYRQAVAAQLKILAQKPGDRQTRLNLSSAHLALGTTFYWNSNYEEALEHYGAAQRFLELLKEADPENDLVSDKLATTYVRTGETLSWQNKPAEGEKYVLKGLKLIEPVVRRSPKNARYKKSLWVAHLKAGEIYLDLEKLEKSLDHYQKSLELAKFISEGDPDNVNAKRDLALSYNKVGDTLDSMGRGRKALGYARKALGLQQEIAAADPKNFEIRSQIANTYKRIGYAYTTMKDPVGARDSFQNALRQYERLAAADPNDSKLPRDIAIVSQTIGQTYLAAAENSDRRENLRRALTWIEKSRRILLDLKRSGQLPEYDDKLIAEIEKEIADTKARLGEK